MCTHTTQLEGGMSVFTYHTAGRGVSVHTAGKGDECAHIPHRWERVSVHTYYTAKKRG